MVQGAVGTHKSSVHLISWVGVRGGNTGLRRDKSMCLYVHGALEVGWGEGVASLAEGGMEGGAGGDL